MKIPFLSFDTINNRIRKDMVKAFEDVFDSKWYVLGENVEKFEKEYASFNRVKYCVGVSNGLDALFLSLKALNVGPGDEVIVPSNTYIASWLAVSYTGAIPIPVEPDEATMNINPAFIESAITSRTKAIMPVHLYGQCCLMDEIMDIATKNKLFVVEDNAQSQGASFMGKSAGSFGDINATSFYPGKNLGAIGDAGAITTNTKDLSDKVTILRNYGSKMKYYNEELGFNMRIDELQAAFLSIKLEFLEFWTKERQQIARWYDELLMGIGDIKVPVIAQGASHVYHLYVIRTEKRNSLQNFLNKNGIGTLIHYPVPPHLQKAYDTLHYKKGDFCIAEKIADTCLSIPVWPGLSFAEAEFTCETIKNFFHG